MKTSLRLSTRQHLAFTPQIQQTIRMLALGAKELSEEIEETLNTNPLLEEITPVSSAIDPDSYSSWMENQAADSSLSFEDHLIRQLGLRQLPRDLYACTCIVIACLDDSGYLRLSNQALIDACRDQGLTINADHVVQAISIIRQLEPAGIGSVDLADCFKQQLTRYHHESRYYYPALSICEQLEILAQDPCVLAGKLNIEAADFEQALALIKQLNPSPARSFETETTEYIQPDILLAIDAQTVQVSINPQINRNIQINSDYVRLLKQSSKAKDKTYLKKNLNGARWWMNALAQRNLTLLRVAEHMITTQRDFFMTSRQSLKPLTQKNIAEHLDLHVSTISRAIKDKTIQTPSGIIFLKTLLAVPVSTDNNNLHSNQSVKLIIRELIKNESSQTPLSDSKIVEKLKTRGIRIARRTVSKYREQLNIPASNLRRIKH